MNDESITMSEILAAIDEKVATDDDFRANLIADPRGTLNSEYDLDIPDDYDIEVHEFNDSTGHLVLPFSSELSDAELKEITGGRDGREKRGRYISILLSRLLTYQKPLA